MPHQNSHLAVIGDRDALVWVLENQRVAFPRPRYRHIFPNLGQGDVLYLYTTRSCYKNPTRDRGLIIGTATVTGPMVSSEQPLRVRDRELPLEAPISVETLAPVNGGINLADQISHVTSFPKPDSWSVYLRRSLLQLTEQDAHLFDSLLDPHTGPWADRLAGYRLKARVDAA